MRILVVGAGSIGGYFGGRLLEAGRDVTFLVRSRRASDLARTGLAIRSPVGDVNLPAPPTVAAERLSEPFDPVLLSCQAYDPGGGDQQLRTGGRTRHRDPAPAQWHAPSRSAGGVLRRRARAGRPVPDLRRARSRGPHPAPQRDAHALLR